MRFYDFEIRAWQRSATRAEVIVHNSPGGNMRKPVAVSLNKDLLDDWRFIFVQRRWYEGKLRQKLIDMGQGLAQIILPDPVFTLLTNSLEKVPEEDGVRIRLCLDSALIDLPWEYLYRPDRRGSDGLEGFLCLDPRLSLVREPPIVSLLEPSSPGRQQRMIFAGMLGADGDDYWRAKDEYKSLCESLTSVADLLLLEEFTSTTGERIERTLLRDPKKPAVIFHYTGYTNETAGEGYLLRQFPEIGRDRATADPNDISELDIRSNGENPLFSKALGTMLHKAKTRLAVFSASNSGRWPFVEPLVLAGLPVIIGMQGETSPKALTIFCHKLYADLALGLTLDEAISSARLKVFQDAGTTEQPSYEWGALMVYMPSSEALLLPRPPDDEIRKRQDAAQTDRQRTIKSVGQVLRAEQISAANVSRHNLRQAILNKLSEDDLNIISSDVEEELCKKYPEEQFNLEIVGGKGLESMINNLINYLGRKNKLDYLINKLKEEKYRYVIDEYIKLDMKSKESDSN